MLRGTSPKDAKAGAKPSKSFFGGSKKSAEDTKAAYGEAGARRPGDGRTGTCSAPPARSSSNGKKLGSGLRPKEAAAADPAEDDDEEFVPEEEEAGAEQHALGTQGDGLMSAKFRRAKSTGPMRGGNFDDPESGTFSTAVADDAPAPRRPPAAG